MKFEIFDLGLINFKNAWHFQREVLKGIKAGYLDSALIACRHHPVITLGRTADKDNILVSEDELNKKGIQVYQIERGGDVTYHGPGQLTAYPIFNLNFFKKDLHWFLRQLEAVAIDFFSGFGIKVIKAIRLPGITGVWIENQKIASIGISVKNWITFHGLSINVKKDDLDNFSFIRPCGMNIEMTSLETILGSDIEIDDIKQRLTLSFKNTLLGSHNAITAGEAFSFR